ncbi:hypothetical protein Tsubulata_036750 [Turnera subulata]|uniref:Uncharacterized protein n=1 Tax=Turnera subulata TaxID=218843 RepID=A0A9Q0J6W8_9ROSI|nr:hypothetical protein Tsubulata_036750 [Turnera subulata]
MSNMGSLSGILQRPVVAAAAVAAASVSGDLSERFRSLKSSFSGSVPERSHPSLSDPVQEPSVSWTSYISVSELKDLFFVNRVRVPIPDVSFPTPRVERLGLSPNGLGSCVASSSFMLSLYRSVDFANGPKPSASTKTIPTSHPDVLYRWHLPQPSAVDVLGSSDCSSKKSKTVVVLLGWLGSKQKHLRKYAEWYTSRGFHAITFTFPMSEVLSYQVGGKAEEDVELLVDHLAAWMEEEDGKNLVFHTFSNTGWLTYGVILQQFQKQDPSLMGRIRGCIVDSAPVAAPDPQVWASGFSAAFLKKNSVATKMHMSSDMEVSTGSKTVVEPKPAITESALLVVLEKFFDVVLNLPAINRRLSGVLNLLSSGQPSCPQLYIYSSADKVIPADYVESFIEKQRKAGHEVRACNFVNTPHVDHFRNDPKLYSTQLSRFLDDCVLSCGNHSLVETAEARMN